MVGRKKDVKKDGKKTENVYANKCKEVKTRLHAFQYSCPSNSISNQSSFLGLRISECKFDGKHFDIRVAYQKMPYFCNMSGLFAKWKVNN